ncbi:MAG TPA: hypothetical protein VI306_24400 [Pyrinomonadaceae bacterium]
MSLKATDVPDEAGLVSALVIKSTTKIVGIVGSTRLIQATISVAHDAQKQPLTSDNSGNFLVAYFIE